MTPVLPKPLPTKLNLGCGRARRDDCLNVDRRPSVGPDLQWDLDQYPYPLPSQHFEMIYALDIVEHLADLPVFMEEAHRLLRPDGVLEVTTPHFSCANSYTDPTHRLHLGYFSFDFFTATSPYDFESPVGFIIDERLIVFHAGRLARLWAWAANRWPERYERRFAWVYPAWFLRFRLKAIARGTKA